MGVSPGDIDDARFVGVSLGETMVARIRGLWVLHRARLRMIKCVWIVNII